MHSDYPTLENMRQNLTHSILQRACQAAWKIVSGFGLSDDGKNTHRTKARIMYQSMFSQLEFMLQDRMIRRGDFGASD